MRTIIAILMLAGTSAGLSQILFEEHDVPRTFHPYDVLHYRLVLNFDESKKEVNGTTSITFIPATPRPDSVRFDAVRMDIRSVRLQTGEDIPFSNDSSSVSIFLGSETAGRETVTVAIGYSCIPEKGLYFIQPDSGDLTRHWQIWTQGEESENRYWFPCYDFPNDKATSEVIATVRDSYTLLSNGSLISEEHDTTRRTRTFHWAESKPHSSYLIMLAAGEYSVLRSRYGNLPILDYVYPEDVDNAARTFRKTEDIIRYFEKVIDYPYPWEKHAHVFLDDFMWGGMENTSAVTLNNAYIYDQRAFLDYSADDVIAHELAHQWWGDLVTCSDWSNLWLNEGFANFYEALFKRDDRGLDEYQNEAYEWSRNIRRVEESSGRKPVVSPESYTINLYQKGGWALRMLSFLLGEKRFFQGTAHYARKHEFGNATTGDLLEAMEESTGEDLRWFFNQWLYGTGYPALRAETEWDGDAGILTVTISQTQTRDSLTGFFRFPMDIELTTEGGKDIQRVWISDSIQTFRIPLDGRPLMVILDKGLNVLKSLDYPKTRREYLYQVAEADDVPDRLDALDALEKETDDDEVFRAVRTVARNDPFWRVRVKATTMLGDTERDETREVLLELAHDDNSRVREAAVKGLGNFGGDDVADFIAQLASTDSSYVVLSACISTLAKIDSGRAVKLAEKSVSLDSYRDMIRRASLHAFRTVRDTAGLRAGFECAEPDHNPFTRLSAIGLIKDLGKENRQAETTMRKLAVDPLADIRAAAVRALGEWGGDENITFLEQRREKEKDEDVRTAINDALDGK